jgi:hypothetical protein
VTTYASVFGNFGIGRDEFPSLSSSGRKKKNRHSFPPRVELDRSTDDEFLVDDSELSIRFGGKNDTLCNTPNKQSFLSLFFIFYFSSFF